MLLLYADGEEPVITNCPASQTLQISPGETSAPVYWIEPATSDNSNSVTLTFNGPGTNGGTYEMGVTIVSYTAIDESGNQTYCTFAIVVSGEDV